MAHDGGFWIISYGQKTILGISVRYFLFIIFSDFAENYELVAHEIVALDGIIITFIIL